jgi:Dockerin type I domain
MYKFTFVFFVFITIILFSSNSYADNPKDGEEINWQVISNGGTDGSSTNYGLQGTVSQTATGDGSSASYGLNHGFWQDFGGSSGPCQGECGDANGDLTVNVSDAVWVINYVFVGGDPPQPVLACGDANSDGTVNVSDAVWVINYVFVGGDSPGDCAPGTPEWGGNDCCVFTP